jgi:hypothetical protein
MPPDSPQPRRVAAGLIALSAFVTALCLWALYQAFLK